MEWLTVPLGLIIGVTQGAVGAGGSIIAVPLLVYLVDVEAKAAVTASLVVVGLVSLVGMTLHARTGGVRFVAGIVFGVAGVAASVGGSLLNRAVDSDVLLLSFAGLMALAAVAMGRSQKKSSSYEVQETGASGLVSLTSPASTPVVLKVVLAGSAVGFVTGFFGVGGGFIIVPVLSLVLGYAIREAIGTGLLVTVINSGAALLSRLDTELLPWDVIVPFIVAGLVGVIAGSLLAGRLTSTALIRGFAALVLVLAGYTAVRSIIELS